MFDNGFLVLNTSVFAFANVITFADQWSYLFMLLMKFSLTVQFEMHHEKTWFLHMRKQRCS